METISSARGKSGAGTTGNARDQRYVDSILKDDREDEMNENIGYVLWLAIDWLGYELSGVGGLVCRAVHSILGDLKKQAQTMNQELDEQNKTIDRINRKVDVVTTGVTRNTDRTNKIS
jgi:hypothetical protein